ncbi:hypothetical protein M5K25_000335 [Dendrobium thyrsiflorum]|uniref:Uncharacterized protein n=1 Tax=Dendrobium thyrsiflorum TaxID=117978 RepID=A0ABD0VTR6_DENTH
MEDGIARQSAGYTPSVWGDYFIKNQAPCSSTTQKTEELMRERVEELVREVKNLLDNTYKDELQSLELIDSLQRLGVGYHFEEEIDKRLREIHDHNGKIEGNDLQAVALKFRLLRQHGYNVTSGTRIPRLGARYYMRVYEQDKESKNDIVLELAMLDFNLLQLLHNEEVKSLSIWWEKIVHDAKFNFSRDRIVECYFWILSVYFEPQYSMARKITTKVIALLSITDDIYDVYGTSDELQSFTDVIIRWDEEAAQQLKEYLKVHFHNLTKALQDFDNELSSHGKSYRVKYLKEILKVVVRAWDEEVKWRDDGYIPALREHLEVSTVTTC